MGKPRWDVRGTGGTTYGPFTLKQIRAGVRADAITRRSRVRPAGTDGEDGWARLGDVKELRRALDDTNGRIRFFARNFLPLFVVPLLLAATGFAHWMAGRADAASVHTRAEVVDIHRETHNRTKAVGYAPVFVFETAEGRAVRVRSDAYFDHGDHQIGQQIAVAYDPDDPEDAWPVQHTGWDTARYSGLVLVAVVSVLYLAGVGRRARRRRKWLEERTEEARSQIARQG